MEIKGHTAALINHTFQTLLISYLVLLLLEQLIPGFVSTYLNLNYLLVIVILAGILDVFTSTPKPKKTKPKTLDYLFIVLLASIAGALIFYKTQALDTWLQITISTVASLLILLLSLLILKDEEEFTEFHPTHKFYVLLTLGLALLANLLAILLPIFTSLTILESYRIVLGSILVLFLPGFAWTFIFFKSNTIDTLERIALSFALSIAIVPLTIFYANLLGLPITTLSATLITLTLTLIPLGILLALKKKRPVSHYE